MNKPMNNNSMEKYREYVTLTTEIIKNTYFIETIPIKLEELDIDKLEELCQNNVFSQGIRTYTINPLHLPEEIEPNYAEASQSQDINCDKQINILDNLYSCTSSEFSRIKEILISDIIPKFENYLYNEVLLNIEKDWVSESEHINQFIDKLEAKNINPNIDKLETKNINTNIYRLESDSVSDNLNESKVINPSINKLDLDSVKNNNLNELFLKNLNFHIIENNQNSLSSEENKDTIRSSIEINIQNSLSSILEERTELDFSILESLLFVKNIDKDFIIKRIETFFEEYERPELCNEDDIFEFLIYNDLLDIYRDCKEYYSS